MKLLIDIGNTATKFGYLDDEFHYLSRCFNSELNKDKLDTLLPKGNIEEIYASSVAPKITELLSEHFKSKFALEITEVSVTDLDNLKIDLKEGSHLVVSLLFKKA